MTSLTVAVLAFNNPTLTNACFQSILGQYLGSDVEVEYLLIDNGSDPPLAVPERYPIQVVRLEKNRGNIGGQNAAFENAAASNVLFVSNDVCMLAGSILNLWKHSGTLLEYGQIQPTFFRTNGMIDNAGLYYLWPGYGFSRPAIVCDLCPIDVVPSIAYMMRKDVWKRVGGFDETLPSAYEDVDMGLRLKKLGLKNYAIGCSAAVHIGNATLGKTRGSKFHEARLMVIKKNFTGFDRSFRCLAIQGLDRLARLYQGIRNRKST